MEKVCLRIFKMAQNILEISRKVKERAMAYTSTLTETSMRENGSIIFIMVRASITGLLMEKPPRVCGSMVVRMASIISQHLKANRESYTKMGQFSKKYT